MAVDFTIKQDDLLPEIEVTLVDANGYIPDVSDLPVRFILADGNGTVKVDEEASIVDGPNGVVKYSWIQGDTDTDGNYNGEFEVTFAGDKPETFPNDKHIKIKIKADLGGTDGN